MATPDLHAQISASAHLSHFWPSSKHQKPFKIELEVFVPKTVPKICDNFTGSNDMAMKLCWLTDMTKIDVHL